MSSQSMGDPTSVGGGLPGLGHAWQALAEVIRYPLQYADSFERLGIEPPKGVLLYGPPGCGKTLLVKTAAARWSANLLVIQGPEVLGSDAGDSERRLRERFTEATDLVASSGMPVIVFIDEIDAIAPNRDRAAQHECRTVAQLLTLMDGLEARGRLIVIGATNRPNALDPALRRPGRFDREIHIEIPDVDARRAILSHYASRLPLSDEVSIDTIARITNGYVGADLAALCRTAATFTVQRRLRAPSMTSLVTMQDFFDAMKTVPPSVRRGYTVNVAETKWSDIGGMDHVKKKLIQVIEWPIMYGDTIKRLGLRPARGILLYGPPGCSKTTLVKVVATQSNASFFSINGAALYSSYVGDSERIVRELFHKARASSPAIIFLDEVDTIVGSRDFSGTGSNSGSDGVQERILSTLLNEMDGVEDAKNVLVVGATNRPDMLDPALLRPGRFDRLIYVPPPDETARLEIFKIQTKKTHLAGDIDLEQLARQTELYSGADVANLCKEAAMAALREDRRCTCVCWRHFVLAMETVKPSITREQLGFYTRISTNYEGTGHC